MTRPAQAAPIVQADLPATFFTPRETAAILRRSLKAFYRLTDEKTGDPTFPVTRLPERGQFALIFKALGLDPVTAIRLGSAWAAGPENEPTDFRKLWGESFADNDAAFWSLAGRIPAAIRDKWIAPTLRRRPAFVAEALKIARARAQR